MAEGPGRPPKITAKATASRKLALERLRRELTRRLPDASDRDAVGLANQLRAIAAELSSYEPEPEDADSRYLRELRERGRARRADSAAPETA